MCIRSPLMICETSNRPLRSGKIAVGCAPYRRLICRGLLFSLFAVSCASTPLPKNSSAVIPEDFFGIVHAGRTRTREEYRLLDEMEVRWILNTFYWDRIERERGNFYFADYDAFVDTANNEGKKILAVLGYETPWLYPKGKSKRYISPENIPFFLNFVEETVRHFRGRVHVWNIWNEPNLMFSYWKGPRKDYIELTRLTAQRIREVDPDAYIMGGAFWRAPAGLIKSMRKAGAMENLDGLAFHPYSVYPRGAMQAHDKLLNILSTINYSNPVWITEVGYPTAGWYPTKVSLNEFPAYVVKTITGAAARGARALLWYQLLDDYNKNEVPPGTFNSEDFFGLVYPNYERKNGAWAYQLCARYLPGSRYTSELPQRENVPSNIAVFCFLGGVSGGNTLILWNDRNSIQKAKLSLSGPVLLHDITSGKNSSLTAEAAVEIGKTPLFITWQGAGIPRLEIVK